MNRLMKKIIMVLSTFILGTTSAFCLPYLTIKNNTDITIWVKAGTSKPVEIKSNQTGTPSITMNPGWTPLTAGATESGASLPVKKNSTQYIYVNFSQVNHAGVTVNINSFNKDAFAYYGECAFNSNPLYCIAREKA